MTLAKSRQIIGGRKGDSESSEKNIDYKLNKELENLTPYHPYQRLPKNGCFFSAEDFLDDVRHAIRRKFGNQTEFARLIPVSRNVISRVINDPEGLNMYWVNTFASLLDIDLGNYIF